MINGYIQKYLNTRKMSTLNNVPSGFSTENMKTIQVEGMTCNHCKANVENSIKSSDGVTYATANHLPPSGSGVLKK
jgi:hypothetical protein